MAHEGDRGPVRVGLVGCGHVSGRYLQNISASPEIEVVACADALPENAARVALEHGIAESLTVDHLMSHDGVELVLNLTIPAAHAAVSMQALEAGKHVYTEKPLAGDVEEGRRILRRAAKLGLRVGSAPDTFMGAGIQSCRSLITSGAIGTPVSANAFMLTPGPERFHPNPDFLYARGAGPLLDGGPYYLSALMSLLGPISRVTGRGRSPRQSRAVETGPRIGAEFPVEVFTHLASLLEFATGALATLVTSFDVIDTRTPRLEVHGTEGSIIAPAPNSWGGPAWVRRRRETDFVPIDIDEVSPGYMGMGLVDMAMAIRSSERHIASGARALHALDVMEGILFSADRAGEFVEMTSVDPSTWSATKDAVPA